MKLLRWPNGCVLFKDKFVLILLIVIVLEHLIQKMNIHCRHIKIQRYGMHKFLLALTGLNATGKTTALELLSAIAQMVQGKNLNDSSPTSFFKIAPF